MIDLKDRQFLQEQVIKLGNQISSLEIDLRFYKQKSSELGELHIVHTHTVCAK